MDTPIVRVAPLAQPLSASLPQVPKRSRVEDLRHGRLVLPLWLQECPQRVQIRRPQTMAVCCHAHIRQSFPAHCKSRVSCPVQTLPHSHGINRRSLSAASMAYRNASELDVLRHFLDLVFWTQREVLRIQQPSQEDRPSVSVCRWEMSKKVLTQEQSTLPIAAPSPERRACPYREVAKIPCCTGLRFPKLEGIRYITILLALRLSDAELLWARRHVSVIIRRVN
jgi:hypothetical protein